MLSTTEASASFASAGFRAMRRSSASIAFSTWALETTRTGGRSFGPTEAASRCRASRSFFSSSRNFAACRSLAPKLAMDSMTFVTRFSAARTSASRTARSSSRPKDLQAWCGYEDGYELARDRVDGDIAQVERDNLDEARRMVGEQHERA